MLDLEIVQKFTFGASTIQCSHIVVVCGGWKHEKERLEPDIQVHLGRWVILTKFSYLLSSVKLLLGHSHRVTRSPK